MERGSVLVTGATGLVGCALAEALVRRGEQVRVLVRDVEKAKRILPEAVRFARGDVTVPEALSAAFEGVNLVFHAAGMPEQWQRDERTFDRVNRQGTANVLSAAHAAGVERVVYTSTMDVFAAPPGGTLVETRPDPHPKPTAYERSKQAAEREADKVEKLGLDVVHVNPGAVYGPSPVVTGMNSVILRLLEGKAPVLPPGGFPLAFIDGVVAVHLAAAHRGKKGERYLVADEHVTMAQFARLVLDAQGHGRRPPKTAPGWLLRGLAGISAPLARVFGFKPLVAPSELAFLSWDIHVDAGKAMRELGFVPTPAPEGVRRTVVWLQERGRRSE